MVRIEFYFIAVFCN